MISKKALSAAGVLLLSSTEAIGIGYNSECQLDSECRQCLDDENCEIDRSITDVCCALLIYEANDVTIKKRECLSKSALASAGGSYDFEGVTTTDAFCDNALSLHTAAGVMGLAVAITTLSLF